MNVFAPREWTADERRSIVLGVAGAAVLVLVGLVAALVARRGGLAAPLGLLLVALLAVLAVAFLTDPRVRPAQPAPPRGHDLDEGPPVLEETLLSVKCGRCGTVFDVTETGARPLRHTCPGCGAAGVLEAEPPSAGDVQGRFVRVRCGACGHLDRIADPGTRPLRHRCPRCGRLGQTRPSE